MTTMWLSLVVTFFLIAQLSKRTSLHNGTSCVSALVKSLNK